MQKADSRVDLFTFESFGLKGRARGQSTIVRPFWSRLRPTGVRPYLRPVDARRVLVLGGAGGTGSRVVDVLLRKGDIPSVLDGSCPSQRVPYEILDLSDARDVKHGVGALIKRAGGLDALIVASSDEDHALQAWQRMLDLALIAAASAARAALPSIARAGGTITLIACASDGPGSPSIRSMCRMGVIGLGRGLSQEGAGRLAVTTLIASGRSEEERQTLATAAIRALGQQPSAEAHEIIVPAPAHLTIAEPFAADGARDAI